MLLCFKCAAPYQPAHETDDYCRVCHVLVRGAKYRRDSYRRKVETPEARAAYNEHMRLYMQERRANGQDKTRPRPRKKESA